jgi:glycogen debranching enzyme
MLSRFRTNITFNDNNYPLLVAGLPGFPRNFSRDSFLSGLLMNDHTLLEEQLRFSMALQGAQSDPLTGEELGKIHHEYPSFTMPNGLETMYNACDTTALFCIVADHISAGSWAYDAVSKSAQYIVNHLQHGLFTEDPSYSNATAYALKVTYWKDSTLLQREDGEPDYPAQYFLAHCMNLAGLRAAKHLLKTNEFDAHIEAMKQGIGTFYNAETNTMMIAKDTTGDVYAVSDDYLHGLYYLEPSDVSATQLDYIIQSSKELETDFGYRTNSADFCDLLDSYHSCTLWPFEQGFIYLGAQKFVLIHVMDVAKRVVKTLDTDPEILLFHTNNGQEYKKSGNDPQLWTVAVKQFFTQFPK